MIPKRRSSGGATPVQLEKDSSPQRGKILHPGSQHDASQAAPREEPEHVPVARTTARFDQRSNLTVPDSKAVDNVSRASGSTVVNPQYESTYQVENIGLQGVGGPQEIIAKLEQVGYQCLHFLAVQVALLLSTDVTRVRALLLEGPSGCGKSYLAKSLAQITGAELMCLSCYRGMPTQNLIEAPSTLAMANAMAGRDRPDAEKLMNLGILSRAFLRSQEHPVILLVDELDKPDSSIDTFFLGPLQDARIWLESRPPIDARPENLLVIFTKNMNRVLDEALLRRCHPVRMTYLDSALERKILEPHCHPQLVANLVSVADRMRNAGGSYQFERPPAPEELLTAGHYITHLLNWGLSDLAFVGRNIWAIIAKSEHDRAVLEHMMRFHPDFLDPDVPEPKSLPLSAIHARLGAIVLDGLAN